MYKKVILFCCISAAVLSCRNGPWGTVMIVNNSDEDILWKFSLQRSGEWYDSPSISSWLERDEYIILRGDTAYERIRNAGLEENLTIGWIKYYFFNLDSIKTISWQRICAERIILKEVVFNTWEDFEACNFTITYP